jgi:hypothetical protein
MKFGGASDHKYVGASHTLHVRLISRRGLDGQCFDAVPTGRADAWRLF